RLQGGARRAPRDAAFRSGRPGRSRTHRARLSPRPRGRARDPGRVRVDHGGHSSADPELAGAAGGKAAVTRLAVSTTAFAPSPALPALRSIVGPRKSCNIRRMWKWALALVLWVNACAPRPVPAPVVTIPKFREFTQPPIPPAYVDSPIAAIFIRGLAFFQTGDLKTAEREFLIAATAAQSFYPPETSLGYLELARKDPKAALPHFERVLERDQKYVPALVGRGQGLIALNREADAVASFEAALAIDPGLTEVRRRVEVLKFRGLEQRIARARELARQGRTDDALQAYSGAIASAPDSAFLYREIAAIEKQKGNLDAALADFRNALALDAGDARSLEQIGEILESREDLATAEKAYADALALEANPAIEKKLEAVRDRIALALLPAEYRAIDDAPQITRGDLAALI